MKKLLASVLAIALTLSLAACGKSADPVTSSPVDTSLDETVEPTEWKPEKPITIINPYKAGGNGDLEIKAMQPALEAALGQPIISEYLTTGSGVAATEKVYNADPDGYTLLYLSNPAASVSQLTDEVDYDIREFEFLRSVSGEWRCVGARPELGITNVEELKALASEKTLTIAHSGIGSSGHIQTLLVENALGIDLNDVPFDGSAAAKTAFLGGHVDLWAIDGTTIAPLIESGDAVAIATCGAERHKALPDVPTFAELGYDGVLAANNRGLVAPPVEALIEAINTAMDSEGMVSYGETSGSTWHTYAGEDYEAYALEVYNSSVAIAPQLG